MSFFFKFWLVILATVLDRSNQLYRILFYTMCFSSPLFQPGLSFFFPPLPYMQELSQHTLSCGTHRYRQMYSCQDRGRGGRQSFHPNKDCWLHLSGWWNDLGCGSGEQPQISKPDFTRFYTKERWGRNPQGAWTFTWSDKSTVKWICGEGTYPGL